MRMPIARVVLVHGIRTSATMWRARVRALGRLGVAAEAIDLPGHGAREGEAFTVDAAVDVIRAALDEAHAAGDAPVLLAGLSLGGYLSIETAGRHPELVDGLVAAGSGALPRGAGLAGYLAIARLIHRLPDRGRALNDAMARAFLPPEAVRDLLDGGIALDVMEPALLALARTDPRAALADYPGPVWFVNGGLDHFRLDERRLLEAARDARLVVVPGATHLVSLVDPESFDAAVLGAVAEVQRRRALAPRRATW